LRGGVSILEALCKIPLEPVWKVERFLFCQVGTLRDELEFKL
jgi:hypothetical protein